MKKALTSIVAATVLAGSAFAADIALNNDGLGDYLVVPAYFANQQGWTTNIKLTNTDTKNAIVSKIVFREGIESQERLDFLIFLSPGDVWEGKVYYENGAVKINSTDDSTVFTTGVTSATNPLNKEFFTSTSTCTQNAEFGYVEIFAGKQIPAVTVNSKWEEGTPLDKKELYTYYNDLTKVANWSDAGNSLFAVATIDAPASQLSTTIKAVAFQNFAESAMSLTTGTNTIWTEVTDRDQNDALTQIDALLKYSTAYVNFAGSDTAVNDTVLYLNTPTKKYWYDLLNADLSTVGYVKQEDTTKECKSEWYYKYSLAVRDQQENTKIVISEFSGGTTSSTVYPITQELGSIVISGNSEVMNYKNGIAYVNFLANNYNNQNVVPATIPVAMTAVTVGGTAITNAYTPIVKR